MTILVIPEHLKDTFLRPHRFLNPIAAKMNSLEQPIARCELGAAD